MNVQRAKLSRYKDITGLKVNKATAIRFIGRDKSRCAIWEFRCDCGNLFTCRGNSVIYGKTHSCGCVNSENCSKRSTERKLPIGVAHSRELFGVYKRSAKKRNLSFSISLDDFLKLTKMDCHYCGSFPSNKTKFVKGNGSYTYNGLDRVDNLIGYNIDNLVPCCRQCNISKRDLSLCEFKEWIKKLISKNI